MNDNLACSLTDSVARGADDPALRMDDVVISYGRLDELTAQKPKIYTGGVPSAQSVAAGEN